MRAKTVKATATQKRNLMLDSVDVNSKTIFRGAMKSCCDALLMKSGLSASGYIVMQYNVTRGSLCRG